MTNRSNMRRVFIASDIMDDGNVQEEKKRYKYSKSIMCAYIPTTVAIMIHPTHKIRYIRIDNEMQKMCAG